MRDHTLASLSDSDLHADQARLERELRSLRYNLDVGYASDAEEYAAIRAQATDVGSRLNQVCDEIGSRVAAGGAR
jgi:hypothetical protein